MAMVTSNWGSFVKGVSARIDEIIDETKNLAPSFMSYGLHKKVQADGLIYRTKGVTGLNYTELFDEGDSIKEDKTYEAYGTNYVMKGHGKIVSISQMLAKTRESDLEAKLDEVRQEMIAANRALDKWAWQILVDSTVTTDSSANFPTARLDDGVSFFSASHPSKVSGVANRSNIVTGNPVLSKDSLFTAINQIREQLNGRGLPIGYQGKFVLVVPPKLLKTAMELAYSELAPHTTDNQFNYYRGVVADVLEVVYLGAAVGGSDTAWYVFAKDVPDPSMRYVSLIDPKIEREVDFDTKAIRVSIDFACAFGYSNFEHAVRSAGA